MRFLAIPLILACSGPAVAADYGPTIRFHAEPGKAPATLVKFQHECAPTTAYVAEGRNGAYTGEPLKPRKLTELPPGNMYAAVFHHDANGCEAPIVVKYDVGRR
jgi:hypothetical protein